MQQGNGPQTSTQTRNNTQLSNLAISTQHLNTDTQYDNAGYQVEVPDQDKARGEEAEENVYEKMHPRMPSGEEHPYSDLSHV